MTPVSTASPNKLTFTAEDGDVASRLDVFLTARSSERRSRIGTLIRDGFVLLNGEVPRKTGVPLERGDVVEITIPPPPPSEAIPQALPLEIVYEDEHLVVVNKAADMVVHPSAGHDTGTLVNALVHRFGVLAPDLGTEDGRPRPGIVHRLDLGTSGVLVVARDQATRDGLSTAIAAHAIERRYLAVVYGTKLADNGTWRTQHDRHPTERRRFTSKTTEGKLAVTHWQVLRRSRSLSLIACRLETGRTHQIRMHCADHHFPIVGDPLYGGARPLPGPEGAAVRKLERQALHALTLSFVHPATGERLTVHGAPPADFAALIESLFGVKDAIEELAAPPVSGAGTARG
jgi:23S rRNA pseudouridine1911/1915/1917 synthase